MTYEIREYTNEADKNLFRDWFFDLDARAAAKITTAIVRLESGNTIIILLAGGTKKRQSKNIEMAKARWADYKARK